MWSGSASSSRPGVDLRSTGRNLDRPASMGHHWRWLRILIRDELPDEGGDHCGVGLVREVAVAVEQLDARSGDRARRPFGRFDDAGDAVRALEQQGRSGDRVELTWLIDPAVFDPALPRDGGRGGDADRPQRALPQGVDLLVGHLQDVDQHGDDGRIVVAGGECGLDRLDRAGRVAKTEARFVEDEVADIGGAGRAADRAAGPVGVPPQGDRSTGAGGHGIDHGGDVGEVHDRWCSRRCREWRRSPDGPWRRWSGGCGARR